MNKKLRQAIKGGVLVCEKRATDRHTVVWIAAVPSVKAQGRTIQEAEELLLDKIWASCNLDEPIALRYEEPATVESEQGSAIVLISVNEVTDVSNPSRYFKDGFCSTCQSGLGRRNDERLQLVLKPKSTLSGVSVRFQPILKCGMRVGMSLLHTSICERLKLECDPLLEFREVLLNEKRLPEFLEVIPKFVAPCVVSNSRSGRVGGVCSKCGAQFIYNDPGKVHISMSSADVIREHGAAAIDSFSRPALCVTAKIWDKIKKMEAGKGLLSCPLVELTASDICPQPKLEKIVPFKL